MKIYVLNVDKLNQEVLFQKAYGTVDRFRKEKVDSCKRREDKLRSLGAGLLLAHGVSEVLKTPWSQLREQIHMEYGMHGKPYLKKWEGISFNLSHSGSYATCVISKGETPYVHHRENEVGIDIQKVRTCSLKVAKKVFSHKEYAGLEEVYKENERQGDLLFSRLWAEMESRGKLLGTGVFWTEGISEMIFQKSYAMGEAYWISVSSAKENIPEKISLLGAEELLGSLDA
ncbi:MAG: 4'-phosphopantetheinyl transferase superfamily protein [Lachnospiraceae bacterium]|nr:4'-phosphopantetheinyl transferase superfamily protein [Lachnospiraceae bacterium]